MWVILPWHLIVQRFELSTLLAFIDLGNSLQWNPVGVVVAGNGTYGNAANQLAYPQGIYVSSDNAIYVADSSNSRVQKWLPNAINGTTVFGTTGSCITGVTGLCYPTTIYGDGQQNLYIGDNSGIHLLPTGASVSTLINGSSGLGINGVFVDSNGNLYASISLNQSVVMWTPAATNVVFVAGGNGWGYSSSQLSSPFGLTVDSSTNTMYIANYQTQTIVAWQVGATAGTTFFGHNSTYGSGLNVLRNPRDVKRDASGNLYILDSNNLRVLLVCSGTQSTDARSIVYFSFTSSTSMALDANLNIYLTDYYNHRIWKFNRIM